MSENTIANWQPDAGPAIAATMPYAQGAGTTSSPVANTIHDGNSIDGFMGTVPGNTDSGVSHSGDIGGATSAG